MSHRRTLTILGIGAVSLALFFYLLSTVPKEMIASDFTNIRWGLFLMALALYVFVNILRASRAQILLESAHTSGRLFGVISVQNLLNMLLPFRAGEISYIHFIHQSGKTSLGKNIASLVSSRMCDVVSILAIAVIALAFERLTIPALFIAGAGVALLGAILALLLSAYKGRWLLGVLRRWFGARDSNVWRWLFEKAEETVQGFEILRYRQVLARVMALSLAGWLCIYASGYVLLLSLNSGLSFGESVFVYTFPVVVSLTPFLGFGGFGGYEGSIVASLSLLGMSLERATSLGILLHLQELTFVILLGAIGVARVGLFSKKKG